MLYYIGKRPLYGYGYDSFWTADHIDAISTQLQWGLREAHNAYLETTLGIGLIGLGLALMAVFCGLATAVTEYTKYRHPLYAYLVGLIVFGLIDGLLESGMAATSLIPFLAACSLMRMAFASETVPATQRSQDASLHRSRAPVTSFQKGI
jgi:O-antigen ligase